MQGGHGHRAVFDSEDLNKLENKSQVSGSALPPLNDICQSIKKRLDELDMNEREIFLERLELKSRWNRSLTVTQLPNEILILIFITSSTLLPSVIDKPDVDYFKFAPTKEKWTKLMLVCRHWCDLVRATPALWRTIDVGKGTDWMKLALARSDDATIDVSFSSHFTEGHAELLKPHYHRLRSLRFWSWPPGALPNSEFPALESLEIPCNPQNRLHRRGVYVMEDLALTYEQLPNLRILQVTHAAVPTDPLFYTRLRKLSLTGCPIKSSLEHFVQLLADSPCLLHLELDRFLQQLDDTGVVGPPRCLPSLRSLRLTTHHPIYSARFLSRIIIPAASLSVSVNIADDDQDDDRLRHEGLCAAIPSDLQNSFPQLSIITWAKLTAVFEGCTLECHPTIPEPGETRLVELALVGPSWEGCLSKAMADFVTIFGSVALAHLETTGFSEITIAGVESWTRLFRTFPSLESLEAEIADPVIEGFLEASRASPVDEPIVCRGLQRITFNDEWGILTDIRDTFRSLVRSLLYRAGRGSRLKELRLELHSEAQATVRRKYLSKLEDVVSDVVLGNAFAEKERNM